LSRAGQTELENGYKAMAADEEYESETLEWCQTDSVPGVTNVFSGGPVLTFSV